MAIQHHRHSMTVEGTIHERSCEALSARPSSEALQQVQRLLSRQATSKSFAAHLLASLAFCSSRVTEAALHLPLTEAAPQVVLGLSIVALLPSTFNNKGRIARLQTQVLQHTRFMWWTHACTGSRWFGQPPERQRSYCLTGSEVTRRPSVRREKQQRNQSQAQNSSTKLSFCSSC
eukprot:484860-Amphidinium_carterae.1